MPAPGTPQRRRSHEAEHGSAEHSEEKSQCVADAVSEAGLDPAADKQFTSAPGDGRAGACNVAVCGLALCAVFFAVLPVSNIAPAGLDA